MTPFLALLPAAALVAGAVVIVSLMFLRPAARRPPRAHRSPLAHEVPYWELLQDGGSALLITTDLVYSRVLEIRGVDPECLDDAKIEIVAKALDPLFQNLPDHATVQLVHLTHGDISEVLTRYRDATRAATGVGASLVQSKIATVTRKELQHTRLHLAVSLPARPNTRPALLGDLAGLPRFAPLSKEAHLEVVRQLDNLVAHTVSALAAQKIAATALPLPTLRRLLYQTLNPARALQIADPFVSAGASAQPVAPWARRESARQQLLFGDLFEMRDCVRLDGFLSRTLVLRSLPSGTEAGMLHRLLVAMPTGSTVQFAVRALDRVRALAQLKRARDRAVAMQRWRSSRDHEAEAQAEDLEGLIDGAVRARVRLVEIALTVVVTVDAHRPDAMGILKQATDAVIAAASAIDGAQLRVAEVEQLREFMAALPGCSHRSGAWHRCSSENAAHMFPVYQSWTGDRAPIMLLESSQRGLLGLNPFDEGPGNPNAFMAGAAGSGKSSTTNYLLMSILGVGGRAMIIDVGGSYRRLVTLFGGDYFAVGDSTTSLNPFFAHEDVLQADNELAPDKLQFMLTVVERMVCEGERTELRNAERTVLTDAIARMYRQVRGRTPLLSDLREAFRFSYELKEDKAIAQFFWSQLRHWTDGPPSSKVNRPSSIHLTGSRVAAFDLKGAETDPALQSVLMLILSGMIWNHVTRDRDPKMVVFDEVWRLLESPASARLIAELYRTSRKYCCSMLTLSQAVEDFTASTIAPALVQNSGTVYLLRHAVGHDDIAKIFQLNARELELFESIEMVRGRYTEALVLHGKDHHAFVRIALTPLEYWLATTHPPDLVLEQQTQRQHPSMSPIQVVEYLATAHPLGAEGRPSSTAARLVAYAS